MLLSNRPRSEDELARYVETHWDESRLYAFMYACGWDDIDPDTTVTWRYSKLEQYADRGLELIAAYGSEKSRQIAGLRRQSHSEWKEHFAHAAIHVGFHFLMHSLGRRR